MDRGVQQIVTPQGDVLVIMPLAQFEQLSAAARPFMLVAQPEQGATLEMPGAVQAALDLGESPLAAWRRYRDISQSELARRSGVSRFTIMRIEAAGIGAGNRQSRSRLANALAIPVSSI
jgi:DNA-binding XRE family transcriptional regulator